MHRLIKNDLKTLQILSGEIESDPVLLRETVDLRDEMKLLCDAHYKAQMDYHKGLKALIEKTAKRIDDRLAQAP